jgi:hypothetical protein
MKQNYTALKLLKNGCLLALTIVLNSAVSVNAQTTNIIETADILSSIRANNLDAFDQMRGSMTAERSRFNAELLTVFRDAKLSNLQRCEAAYYLGDFHVSEAVDPLASDIALQPILLTTEHLTMLHGTIAADALVKIGTPSITAVIRNLEESDNEDIRYLSLKVLYRIDGDKDIVQLRLLKAIAAQKDSNKKARLQAALKSLAKTQFDK